MRKTDKEIISILLLLIMIIAQLSPVFAADYATEETEGVVVYENLTDYIEKTGWYGVSTEKKEKDEITQMWIFGYGNTVIKDMSDIKELTNLEELCIYGTTLQGTINFSDNEKLETIYISEYQRPSSDEVKTGDLSNVTFDFKRYDMVEKFRINI